jgi:hypothetical protein
MPIAAFLSSPSFYFKFSSTKHFPPYLRLLRTRHLRTKRSGADGSKVDVELFIIFPCAAIFRLIFRRAAIFRLIFCYASIFRSIPNFYVIIDQNSSINDNLNFPPSKKFCLKFYLAG